MKTILLLLVGFSLYCNVQAQSPAPEPDTLKEVKQTDPEAKTLPKNSNYTTDQVKITSGQLPQQIKKTLNTDTQYEGWEKGQLYKSKSGDLYVLKITKSDTTRTYQFNASGIPVKE
jgi:hypothetical protein